jgi:hypothetical protein
MQTQYNVKPGDRAKIINSANGEKGMCVGRIVMVLADRPFIQNDADKLWADQGNATGDPYHRCPPSPYDKEHTKLGKIWPVESFDGKPLYNEHGGAERYVDVPDRWLEKILPEEAPPVVKEVAVTESV